MAQRPVQKRGMDDHVAVEHENVLSIFRRVHEQRVVDVARLGVVRDTRLLRACNVVKTGAPIHIAQLVPKTRAHFPNLVRLSIIEHIYRELLSRVVHVQRRNSRRLQNLHRL